MRNILILAMSVFAVSCTTEPVEEYDYIKNSINETKCGEIVGMQDNGEDEYIFVQFDYQKAQYKSTKYKIKGSINDYHLQQKICDFTGMTVTPQ